MVFRNFSQFVDTQKQTFDHRINIGAVALFLVHTLRRLGGPQWRSWLRHCATSRKVGCSIPDLAIGIFHLHEPSGRNMDLGST
jgi:hypothetical protein